MSCAAGGRGHQSGPRSSLIAAAMAIWPAESALEPSALAEGAPPAGARRTRPAAETPLKSLAAAAGSGIPGTALAQRSTRDVGVPRPPSPGALGGPACPVLPRGTADPGGATGLGATPAARSWGEEVMMPQPQQREEIGRKSTRLNSSHLGISYD